MSTPLEDRFTRIVREMDAELTNAQKENAELKSKLRTANYPTEQATNCGRCSVYKHTPWRDDEYGYICATCLSELRDEAKDELEAMLVEILASATPNKKEQPAMFAVWEKAKALLSHTEEES
jgi:superfamily II DNA helicase RecQ